jgi:hypothetical protein
MREQKETVGLATGGEHGGRTNIDGVRETPSNPRPTLASQGIGEAVSLLSLLVKPALYPPCRTERNASNRTAQPNQLRGGA